MTMTELKSGDIAEITGYTIGNAMYRAKLLALGLTRGAKIGTLGVDVGYMYEYLPRYQGEWGGNEDKTWNFVGGLSLTATF